ncbi:MAG: hypothetical protein J7494_10900 [Sphingobium sp.]|nr:hypothetical protein [Sphingobium sp.]
MKQSFLSRLQDRESAIALRPGASAMSALGGFFKRLSKDRSGNVLAVAAAALPLITGCAGLATDTIQWTLWKRQLQRAADSAAIAGVYQRTTDNGGTANTSTAVCRDISLNLHTKMALQGTSPCTGTVGSYTTLSYPTNTSYATNQVTVVLKVRQTLPFSSLFISNPPTITATATAASVSAGGSACIESLATTGTGIFNNGNTTVRAPTCILFSNSTSANSASAGGSSAVTAKAIAAVGGIQQSNNWIVQQYIPYSPALSDPFANVNPDPSDMHCTSAALTDSTNVAALGTTNCFSSMSVGANRTLTMPANFGPIYINGGDVDLKGAFSCVGCTIVLTNTSTAANATIGTVSSNAQATNNITAPTSGTFRGIAIYQDRRATGNTNKVNGGSGSVLTGALYFPSDTLQINGTGDAVSLCSMFIAKYVVFTGTSSLAISSPDDASCSGTGMPSNSATKMVRLIA